MVFGEIPIFVIFSEKSFIKLTGNEMTRLWGWGRVATWAGAGASLVVLQSKGNPGVAIKPDCPSTSGKKFQTETFHRKKSEQKEVKFFFRNVIRKKKFPNIYH